MIPNELYDILTKYVDKSVEEIIDIYGQEFKETILEYFSFLEENDLIYLCTEKQKARFPDLSMEFDSPSLIDNAIIDFDKESDHDLENVFFQLKKLHCRYVQLRFFTPIELDELLSILGYTLNKDFNGINLLVQYSEDVYHQIFNDALEHTAVNSIEFYGVPDPETFYKRHFEKYPPGRMDVFFTNKNIDGEWHCGVVKPLYFHTNIDFFTESLVANSCLNKKLSIDKRGNIKNCPSFDVSYGHSRETPLESVLQDEEFLRLWSITKSEVDICKVCEFRMSCSDCRAYVESGNVYGKPSKCAYDPFTATWRD